MKDFHLKKWYFDAADERGNVYIGYLVALHWGHLELHGYQHVWHTSGTGVQTQEGFTRQPVPRWENERRLAWCPHNLQATWDSVDASINETLFTAPQGEIKWQCLQPRARASVALPWLSFTAWGYTECLDITLPVWDLPFKKLYWGRCLSAHHTIIWIKWSGMTERQLVWHDGPRSAELTIAHDAIGNADWKLQLGENVPLRQGKLISTVFHAYSNITHLLPEAAFLAEERKWYNLGQLESRAGSEPAVTLYEEVIW